MMAVKYDWKKDKTLYHLKTDIIYPMFTMKSITDAKKAIKKRHGRLDVITLDYYLRDKKFGGLGYGKLKKVI
jgi:hypothetical protein